MIAGTIAMVLATAAMAQPVQEEEVDTAFTGVVTSVDAKAGTVGVRGANGEEGIFHVDAKDTTIVSGSEKVALSALSVGDWISIDGDTRGGRNVATYIEIVDDPHAGGGSSRALPTAAGATIEVRHNKLSPASVQIGAGQTVTFHNVDKMPGGHTVQAVDGSFSSPPLDQGQDWSHEFDVPGVYSVQIKEHPDAKASIVVE